MANHTFFTQARSAPRRGQQSPQRLEEQVRLLALALDLRRHARRQRRIDRCQRAAGLLKPRGTLVYCTCSLEPEEGELAIERLLAGESALRRAPIEPAEVAGRSELITAAGDLRTLPSHFPHADPRLAGLDGFFAARLVKA